MNIYIYISCVVYIYTSLVVRCSRVCGGSSESFLPRPNMAQLKIKGGKGV